MQALSSLAPRLFSAAEYDAAMRKKERPPLGQRLVELRQAAGLTQMQLASKLSVHHSNIAFWELSGTPPRGEVLPVITAATTGAARPCSRVASWRPVSAL